MCGRHLNICFLILFPVVNSAFFPYSAGVHDGTDPDGAAEGQTGQDGQTQIVWWFVLFLKHRTWRWLFTLGERKK